MLIHAVDESRSLDGTRAYKFAKYVAQGGYGLPCYPLYYFAHRPNVSKHNTLPTFHR